MKKLLKLFLISFLVGQLPSLPTWAVATGNGWSNGAGGYMNTPGAGGSLGQVPMNVGSNAIDWQPVSPTITTGGGQGFQQAIYVSTGSTAGITNSTNEIAVTSTGAFVATAYGSTTLAANALVPGKVVRIAVSGQLGTSGTSPGSLRFRILLGTTPVVASGFIPMPTSISSQTFTWNGTLLCQSVGSYASSTGGTIVGNFGVDFTTMTPINTTTLAGKYSINSSTTLVSGLVDTTVSNAINATVTWQTATVGNVVIPNSIVYYIEN